MPRKNGRRDYGEILARLDQKVDSMHDDIREVKETVKPLPERVAKNATAIKFLWSAVSGITVTSGLGGLVYWLVVR